MPSSLTILLPSTLGFSPHPPVSVYGTGTSYTIAAFLGSVDSETSLLNFAPHYTSPSNSGFACCPWLCAWPRLLPRGFPILLRPHSSDMMWYRNVGLLSIDYDFRPRLRSRLTLSGSALLRKPWIFGLKDSHLHLATHSSILTSIYSTAPYDTASMHIDSSSTNQRKR